VFRSFQQNGYFFLSFFVETGVFSSFDFFELTGVFASSFFDFLAGVLVTSSSSDSEEDSSFLDDFLVLAGLAFSCSFFLEGVLVSSFAFLARFSSSLLSSSEDSTSFRFF
jgi:hypothetical protein